MRFVVPIILIAVAAVALSLGGSTTPRADFTYINPGSFNTLDPAQMSYHQDIMVAIALWEGLTTPHPQTLEAIEGVAHLPPEISPDRKTYTFRLRPEARWSNGDPVTAADFIRGWRRAIEPGTAEVYAELIAAHLDGAREYVKWRSDQVTVLGLVRRLQEGTPVDPGMVGEAFATEPGRALAGRLNVEVPAAAPMKSDPFWAGMLDRLRGLSADWEKIGDDMLDEHIAEMDDRFAEVGVKAIDAHTLEIRLAHPTVFFLDLTWFPTYSPIHESLDLLRERYKGRPLNETGIWCNDMQWTKPDYRANGYPGVISNGPYRVREWVFKRRLRIEKNPHYWNAAAVKSKTIEAVEVEYQNTAWMLFEQGYADMMASLSTDYTPDLVAEARAGKRHDVHAIPVFGTYYYEVNTRPVLWDGRPNPAADPRVRRALVLAVDKQQLVDHVIRYGNPVSTTLVPPGQIAGYESPAGLPYDPQRARRELAEAGYPGGAGLPPIEILFNTGFRHEDAAQAIARMWERELGIQAQLVGREVKTFAEDKAKGRYMVARSGWTGDFSDPTTFLDLVYSTNGHNSQAYNDPKYDALLDAAARELDPRQRMALLSEAEGYMLEEVPVMPWYTYVMVYAWKPNVRGIYPNPRTQFPFQYIWVETP